MSKIQHLFVSGIFLLCFFLTGCRALPKRNYVGMTRDQVIEAYAETPRTSANEIYVLTVMDPDSEYPWNRTGAHRGLYFHRIEEIRENEIVRRSPYLGIYKRGHWSGYNFVYELYFENEIVVNQKVCSYSDGIVLLPRCFFVDLE